MSPRLAPYQQLQALRRQINRLVDALVNPPEPATAWRPAVDVLECDDIVVVQVEVPGLAAGDLAVELRGRDLTIRGSKRRLGSEPAAARFHLMERYVGAFQVVVELAHTVDPRQAEALLGQGVLTVRLPRLEDRRNRGFTIAVREPGRETDHD